MYKLLGIILLVLGAALAGYLYGKGAKEVQTITVEGKKEIQVVEHTITVTRTVKPDGTVTETTETKDKAENTKEKTRETEVVSKPILSKYSLSLGIHYNYEDLLKLSKPTYDKYYVGAGMRVLALPLWVETTYTPATKDTTLGLRGEL